MADSQLNYREFLVKELKRRQQRNARYSLRAFARDLNISVSRVSEILTNKTGLSVKRAANIAEILEWSKEQTSLFIDLVEAEHNRSPLGRKLAKERLTHRAAHARVIPPEEFSTISEWYYIPMIELLQTKPASYTPAYLGSRLGLDETTATLALAKLQELQLIEWREGTLVARESLRKKTPGASTSIRQFHKQILVKAAEAIDTQALEKRSITSCVMAVDQTQIEMVQERIRQFRLELMKDLEAAPNKNAVYCMSVNFFEMTMEPS